MSEADGIDDLDFILDEVENTERLFADLESSSNFDVLLSNSEGSSIMNFQFELLEKLLNVSLTKTAQENEQTRSCCGSCRSARQSQRRDRLHSTQAQSSC